MEVDGHKRPLLVQGSGSHSIQGKARNLLWLPLLSVKTADDLGGTQPKSYGLYFIWSILDAVKRKKKRNEFFSFPFLRTKKIKRTVSRPEYFYFFLTLTAPNSARL